MDFLTESAPTSDDKSVSFIETQPPPTHISSVEFMKQKYPDVCFYEMDPGLIKFSQSTVTYKRNPTILDWDRWDESKYGIKGDFLLIAQLSDGAYISFDNSRVIIAQNERVLNPEFTFLCDVRMHTSLVKEVDRYSNMIERFQVDLVFQLANATFGVYVATVHPKTFEMLMILKCSQQGEDFSVYGSDVPPNRYVKRSSAVLTRGRINNSTNCTHKETIEHLVAALRNGSQVKYYFGSFVSF